MRELSARSLHARALNCFAVSKGSPKLNRRLIIEGANGHGRNTLLARDRGEIPAFLKLRICFAGVSLSRIRESEMLGTGIYTVKQLFVILFRALWRWEHSPGVRRSAWHL